MFVEHEKQIPKAHQKEKKKKKTESVSGTFKEEQEEKNSPRIPRLIIHLQQSRQCTLSAQMANTEPRNRIESRDVHTLTVGKLKT